MLLMSCGILYIVFRRANQTDLGFFAAIFTLTHPLALAATVTPECYISDMFFACGILFWTTQHSYHEKKFFIGIFMLFLMLGLVRPVSGAMLMPLAIAGQYVKASRIDPRKLTLVALTCVVALLASYSATAFFSGGWDTYRSASQRVMGGAFSQNSMLGGASIKNHVKMLSHYIGWLAILATPAAIAFFIAMFKYRSTEITSTNSKAIILGASWILPPMVFYTVIYYLKPTYQLIYLPCLIIPIGWALSSASRLTSKVLAKLFFIAIAASQALFFFFPPATHLPLESTPM
jgi:hypothetical protein